MEDLYGGQDDSALADAENKQTGQLADSITNEISVKSYARERFEKNRFSRATKHTHDTTFAVAKISFWSKTDLGGIRMPDYSGNHALSLPRLPSASHGHLLPGGKKGWTPPWKTVLLLSKLTPAVPRYWSSLSVLVHQAIHSAPRLTLGSKLFFLKALLCQMNVTAPEARCTQPSATVACQVRC